MPDIDGASGVKKSTEGRGPSLEEGSVRICVDADGGDDAPSVVVDGVRLALEKDPLLNIVLVGLETSVSQIASEFPGRIDPVITTEVIEMGDHPAEAFKTKKDSSIAVGCKLVHDGCADGFFTAGSTGGCLAAATLTIGRIKGVKRPAIATIIPVPHNPPILLDVGANADCKPEYLVQFAHMGKVYARLLLGRLAPTVGLLNNGSEETKGSAFAKEVHALLAENVEGFIGNVEGGDIMAGACDVVVTDGFTGNIALKVLEGTASVLFRELKAAMTSTVANKLAASKLRPAISELKKMISADTYGGAPLLGIKSVCMIGHGSSNPTAIANGVAATARAVRDGLPSCIAKEMGAE